MQHQADNDAWLEKELGGDYGGPKTLTYYEIFEHVRDEHFSMCLMVLKNYPMEFEEIMANSAMLNRYLADEIKRPKDVGYPADMVEFMLGRVVLACMAPYHDEKQGSFEDAYRNTVKPPWERE